MSSYWIRYRSILYIVLPPSFVSGLGYLNYFFTERGWQASILPTLLLTVQYAKSRGQCRREEIDAQRRGRIWRNPWRCACASHPAQSQAEESACGYDKVCGIVSRPCTHQCPQPWWGYWYWTVSRNCLRLDEWRSRRDVARVHLCWNNLLLRDGELVRDQPQRELTS